MDFYADFMDFCLTLSGCGNVKFWGAAPWKLNGEVGILRIIFRPLMKFFGEI